MNYKNYVGIDVGGTTGRIARVNPEAGKIVGDFFSFPVGNVTSNNELTELIVERIPGKAGETAIGISAAGNIDEKNLIIIESPYSPIKEQITFARDLKEKGYDVIVTNDMKAASHAEARFGRGKDLENICITTISSGFNCAIARKNRKMIGCNESPEFGHQPYMPRGPLFCGCGGMGHLEIYVSGNGAAAMAKQYFLTTRRREGLILEEALSDYNKRNGTEHSIEEMKEDDELWQRIVLSITSKHIYEAFRYKPEENPQKGIRNVQVEAIAHAFGRMVSSYNPLDMIVCMGSQATKDGDLVVVPAIRVYEENYGDYHMSSLSRPEIRITEMGDEIGVIGAVAYWLSKRGNRN